MNSKQTGYVIFLGAIGMMCGLLSVDVSKLTTWNQALQPGFIASFLGHIGVVTAAFYGGKLIPIERVGWERTRISDLNRTDTK